MVLQSFSYFFFTVTVLSTSRFSSTTAFSCWQKQQLNKNECTSTNYDNMYRYFCRGIKIRWKCFGEIMSKLCRKVGQVLSFKVIQSEVLSICSKVGCASFDLPLRNGVGGWAQLAACFSWKCDEMSTLVGRNRRVDMWTQFAFYKQENKSVFTLQISTLYILVHWINFR